MTTSPHPSPRAKRTGWLGLLLVLATLWVYWPVRHFDFVNFDDPDYVTTNPRTQAGLTAAGIHWAFTQTHSSNWHPLTWMSHMLDCQLFGLQPGGPHLVNVALHAANVWLLFLLLRLLTAAPGPSALVAGLFALHPLHVESVAWISERKDVLSTFFGLLSLHAYARYVLRDTRPDTGQDSAGLTNFSSRWYWLTFGALALGLLSKPMLVTWPCVFLLLDFWPLKRFTSPLARTPFSVWRSLVVEKAPFFLLTLGACCLTVIAQSGGGATVSLDALPLSARLAQWPVAYALYLGKTFWPGDLAAFYPYIQYQPASPHVVGATLLMLALSLMVTIQKQRRPFLAVGWFWFLGTLIPVIGLVQVGRQAIADRYTYIPHIGLFMALVWGLSEFADRFKISRTARVAASTLVLVICAGLTSRQVASWENTGTLARHALRATPNNYVAHAQLAGVFILEKRWNDAEAECAAALALRPGFAEALNLLATVQEQTGRTDEAIANYQAALQSDPGFVQPALALGTLYLKLGRAHDAEQMSRTGLQLAPLRYEALLLLAQALHSQNRLDEAIATYQKLDALKSGLYAVHRGLGSLYALKGEVPLAMGEFKQALSIQPTNSEAHNSLGMLLLMQGDSLTASNHFVQATTYDPTNSLAHYQLGSLLAAAAQDAAAASHYRRALIAGTNEVELLNDFAWLLATSPEASVRQGAEAVTLAERACVLTRQQAPVLLGTLAAAYAEAGRFSEAIETAGRARDLARAQKLEAVALRNEELLEHYRAQQPYHRPH